MPGSAIDGRQANLGKYGDRRMASGNDMKAHASTYGAFIGLLKWSVPLIAIIAVVVVLVIAT